MKTIRNFAIAILGVFAFTTTQAQTSVTDSVMVNGNCGMCKKNIEKSAMTAGADVAVWDKRSKWLKVTFDPAKTNTDKIQKEVAAGGYDTQEVKANDEAYSKLEECCQYDRTSIKPKSK